MSKGYGNKKKYDTSEKRKELCKSYIEHLKAGHGVMSFRLCDRKTLQRYIKNYPEDFPALELELAIQQGRFILEGQLMDLATGKSKGNALAMLAILNNKYEDWRISNRDRGVKLSGDNANPVKIQIIDFSKIDTTEPNPITEPSNPVNEEQPKEEEQNNDTDNEIPE